MWTIDSIRVFVQDYTRVGTQIIPRLQPLTGPTIYQWFGYESPIITLAGLIVGVSDKIALENLYTTAATVTLSGPYSIHGEYFIKDSTFTLLPAVCQTLRPDLAKDAPVYDIKLELYEE